MIYDIIGDIHGNADKLETLLTKLEYEMVDGVYRQDGHKTIFVGDFIDRGTQNRRTLEIVRNMIEYGDAQSVMGNHEYNAVCYHTLKEGSKTDYLRPHTQSKFRQHEAFLREYPLGHAETEAMIDWFKSLPLYLEFESFRVVHACWDHDTIRRLNRYTDDQNCLKEEYWTDSADERTALYNHIEILLKGEEVRLESDMPFLDKDGNERKFIRIKWWGDKTGDCRDIAFGYDAQTMCSLPAVKPSVPADSPTYPEDELPVFFGHYWQTGVPTLQQQNLCCVDYSAGRGGDLVCYQFRNPDSINGKLDKKYFIC